MKLFHFFVIESCMVVGLPLCEPNFEPFPDPFGPFDQRHRRSVTIPCGLFRDPFGWVPRQLPIEIAPPMVSEVKGTERTELEFHQLEMSQSTRGRRSFIPREQLVPASAINGDEIPDNGCNCNGREWTNLDKNDKTGRATGTGDHESF